MIRTALGMTVAAIGVVAVAGCGSSGSGTADSGMTGPAGMGAGGGPVASKLATGPIGVDLTDFKIASNATEAKAGKVSFVARNTGVTEHEFVVIRTDKPAADLGKGARIPESGNVGETGNIKPGGSKKVTLNLKPGHYALVCNDPGHYMAGMHRDFTVVG